MSTTSLLIVVGAAGIALLLVLAGKLVIWLLTRD